MGNKTWAVGHIASETLGLDLGLRRLEKSPRVQMCNLAEAPWATRTACHSGAARIRKLGACPDCSANPWEAGPGPRVPTFMARLPPWHRVWILGSSTLWLFCCVSPGRPLTSLSFCFLSLWDFGGKQGSPEGSLRLQPADSPASP